jgi:hypothetical protein
MAVEGGRRFFRSIVIVQDQLIARDLWLGHVDYLFGMHPSSSLAHCPKEITRAPIQHMSETEK